MSEFRIGQSVAVMGVVHSVVTLPNEGVYVDVRTASGDGVMSSLREEDIVHLEELVSPKKDLVVIPQFIADWLEKCKDEEEELSYAFTKAPRDVSRWLSLNNWKNERVFTRAWLDGYEVGKEKLYWVRDKKGRGLLGKNDSGTIFGAHYVTVTSQLAYPTNYTFTEGEIKDYDERYWAFAVPAEEDDE